MSALHLTLLVAYLGYCLFLVYYWKTREPLPSKPLNVESNLPLPWLAQTSTVFSWTGLFGAYFGIAVMLGLPALLGLACGTVLGLFLIRHWIERTLMRAKKETGSFEDFLSEILPENKWDGIPFTLLISIAQLVFATSELLILREAGKMGFGLKSEQATLLAVGLAILGYFYVLLGGYVALFRTDRIQLIFVCAMALAFSLYILVNHSQVGWTTGNLRPRPGFWGIGSLGPGWLLYVWHFFIAAVMALGLFLASPDTWKRVYQVNKDQRKGAHPVRTRVFTFVAVGLLPYMVLLPVAITFGAKYDAFKLNANASKGFTLPAVLNNDWIFLAAALALIASFLSSFNGAFLASVHVALIYLRKTLTSSRRPLSESWPEEARFYLIMMTVLSSVSLVFFWSLSVFCNPSRYGLNNPWLLGNLLMGAYSVIGGLQVGTGGTLSRLPKYVLPVVVVVGLAVWTRYFFSSPGYLATPDLKSVETVRVGVILCLAIAGFCGLTRLVMFIVGKVNA